MRTSKHVEQLAGNIHFRPDEKTDERILAAAEAALSKITFTDTKAEKMRIIIMRNPIIRIAVAAVVVIACVIGLSVWRTTGSGIALADVLARMEQVKAYRYKWKITIEDPNNPFNSEFRATVLISQEYGSKMSYGEPDPNDPNGGQFPFGEVYFLPHKKTRIEIIPEQKRYWRAELDDDQVERMQKYNNDSRDPLLFLKEIAEHKYKSLGRSTIDGIEVEGFRSNDPNWLKGGLDAKFWVDVKTRLLVRKELRFPERTIGRNRVSQQISFYDFQWDVPVDAAEFEPAIPDGYTSYVVKYPAHITEETAIQGLKVWVELLGKYPENIIGSDPRNELDQTVLRLAEKSETPAALRLKEELKELTDEEINNKLVDFLTPIRGLARFYATLGWDKKDRAYYGKTVTPKDLDKVLLRWKVSDREYGVIYGDLHAETVSAEKLAELEKALTK